MTAATHHRRAHRTTDAQQGHAALVAILNRMIAAGDLAIALQIGGTDASGAHFQACTDGIVCVVQIARKDVR